MKCEICGKECKNVGVHKFHAHKSILNPEEVVDWVEDDLTKESTKLKVDEITEKPLSELLSNLKEVLKTFRHELDVRISERGGRTSEVEIRVRIQI